MDNTDRSVSRSHLHTPGLSIRHTIFRSVSDLKVPQLMS